MMEMIPWWLVAPAVGLLTITSTTCMLRLDVKTKQPGMPYLVSMFILYVFWFAVALGAYLF